MIERIRLYEPITRVRLADFEPPRPQRRPRGSNKARLITDSRRLIARRELADICGVSVDTVKKWEAKKPGDVGIKPVRLSPSGRSVFYDIADAENFLNIKLRSQQAA
jgi:hypothetical protein